MLMTPAEQTKLIISQVGAKYRLSTERLLRCPTASQSATREYREWDYVARSELAWRLSRERRMDNSRIQVVMNCQKHQLNKLWANWERLQRDEKARAA